MRTNSENRTISAWKFCYFGSALGALVYLLETFLPVQWF